MMYVFIVRKGPRKCGDACDNLQAALMARPARRVPVRAAVGGTTSDSAHTECLEV